MKESIKKQLRLQVIVGMVVVAVIILASDVVENSGYVMKGAALLLGASAFGLFKKWQKKNMLPEVEDL